jgi:predicted O-methyltransferase YrrM
MSTHRTDISSKALDYIKALYTHETLQMEHIIDDLTAQERVMQLSAIEARILQVVIAMAQVKTIVEIGTLAGYSAISMAKFLPQDGKVFAVERSKECIARAQENAVRCHVADRIEFCEGDALKVLDQLKDQGPFDMVFIDADKANYPHYLEWADQNIRQGGIIAADNTLLFGHVYQESCPPEASEKAYHAMRLFNKRLADPKKYTSILVPTIEGLSIGLKK